nr:SGNH/GDSL hydrolase family protein [Fredinandcohnia onubensis]
MKNRPSIPLSYLISIVVCVLLLVGVNGTIETFMLPQESKATIQESTSVHDSLVIQKLNNSQPVTIVAYGDSITWGYERDSDTGRVSQVKNPYPKVLEYELRQKFGYRHIKVINKGHPGWTSIQALNNLEKEVLSYHPDLVILMFGINDARGHLKYSPHSLPIPVEEYKENNQHLLQKIQEKGIEVVIISATTFTSKKNNADLNQAHYTHAISSLAKEENIHYINGSEIPIKNNLKDGIHFKPGQYKLIAEKIMSELF